MKGLRLRSRGTAMRVVIADYDHAAAEQVRGEIAESGAEADALSVDVTSARQVMAIVSDVAQRFGRIDILANIAGGSFYTKKIEDFTWMEFKRVIDTNLKGTFLMNFIGAQRSNRGTSFTSRNCHSRAGGNLGLFPAELAGIPAFAGMTSEAGNASSAPIRR